MREESIHFKNTLPGKQLATEHPGEHTGAFFTFMSP